MILKKILLKNFRNYSGQEIIFNDKFNFIYGNNGHGKTNILEAVSFTTFGKSFLGAAEADCVKFGEKEFFIESDFLNDLDNEDRLVINYNSETRSKSISRNKEKVSSFSSEIFGRYPIVFLSPHSLNITYGNPSDRRKFFDILISQSSRLYLDYLKELAKILRQKNALLKNYTVFKKYSRSQFEDLVQSYNEKLITVSANVIFKRLNFLKEFDSYFSNNFSMLTVEEHEGSISYNSDATGETDPLKSQIDFDEICRKMKTAIDNRLDDEIKRAVSLCGPQRDDYIFRLKKSDPEKNDMSKGFDLKNFASQGEHKTFLVALKLSEFDILKDKKGTNPVLLLDDVLSELDQSRVSKIISHLKEYGQIFLTTTDRSYLDNLGEFYDEKEISVFEIEEGKVLD